MSQHDTLTLREALRSIQYEATSLADAQAIALQALNATYPARAALSATQPAQVAQGEPDDRAMLEVIDERDRCHEWADKLADAIAEHTGWDIGEHSSANNPWSVALEAMESHSHEEQPAPAQGAGEVVAWTWPGTMKRQFTDSKFVADAWVATGLSDVKALTYADTQPAAGADVLDAKRYRWLRAQDNEDFAFAVVKNPHFDVYGEPEELDAAIDAAIAASGRQE